MQLKNIFYAQSGGVTAVINATACAVIETAYNSNKVGKVLAGKNGILGALQEQLIDTSLENIADIAALKHTPGGAFGSCRYKLKDLNKQLHEYERLLEVFKEHNIGIFLYNGGGDSQDTALKVSQFAEQIKYPLQCLGIPKTIDNDLPITDNCPGFGSVAKYVAISTLEAGLDVASMAATSTKVFILEVMGRNAGWIAAAAGLANTDNNLPPHIILFPEIIFDENKFIDKVKYHVEKHGYCTIVASEGLKDTSGKFVSANDSSDSFGHTQLGGLAPKLSNLITNNLKYKNHWAVADYLQRAASHISSATDVSQAYALGKAAVEMAIAGKSGLMPTIIRTNNTPYEWKIGEAKLADVANVEKKMPRNFISADGFSITKSCRQYLKPLIQGQAYPPYKHGLPNYVRLKNKLLAKKLQDFS